MNYNVYFKTVGYEPGMHNTRFRRPDFTNVWWRAHEPPDFLGGIPYPSEGMPPPLP